MSLDEKKGKRREKTKKKRTRFAREVKK